jgi:hypothetical protein
MLIMWGQVPGRRRKGERVKSKISRGNQRSQEESELAVALSIKLSPPPSSRGTRHASALGLEGGPPLQEVMMWELVTGGS